jgi:hypothetical protein
VVGALLAGQTAAAEYTQVINAAVCSPLTLFGAPNTLQYQFRFYGKNATAYCQLQMSSDWPVQNLSYVGIDGRAADTGEITVQVCVYSTLGVVTCGAQQSITANNFVVAYSPSVKASMDSVGAFVEIYFPNTSSFSYISTLFSVWDK